MKSKDKWKFIIRIKKLSKKIYAEVLNEKDFKLIQILGNFSEVVMKAKNEYKPSVIASYLLSLV
ncbi:MAG: DALR anticodon-binding domain-containing protein, partial [Patescibacteria group bacterium]